MHREVIADNAEAGEGYDVSLKPRGGGVEVTVTRGSAYKADEGGVITIGALAGKRP